MNDATDSSGGGATDGGTGVRSAAARLPAAVVALGLVSLLTDLSSEMIYPLLPAFLVGLLGAGAISLGIIEGVAECTASLLKVVSGWWSDRVGRRKPLVVAGYGLSGAARPLIGLAGSWPVVLALRFADRVGKGLRTAPRDALIAGVTAPGQRGRAYGLHRAMDHAGAVAGPLVAAALLTGLGLSLRQVFLLAALPAAAVMGILLLAVREPPSSSSPPSPPSSLPSPSLSPHVPPGPAPAPGGELGRLIAVLVIFALGNSSDAFILLRLGEAGIAPQGVALIWSLHHVVKVLSTYGGGRLADRLPRRALILGAWAIYAAVYLGFALARPAPALVALFMIYGLHHGLLEPSERAWIADMVPGARRATAFGYVHGAVGIAALPASLLFGALHRLFGPAAAFATGAALAGLAALLLAVWVRPPSPRPSGAGPR